MNVTVAFTPSGNAIVDALQEAMTKTGGNTKRAGALIRRAQLSAISSISYQTKLKLQTAMRKNTFGWTPHQRHPQTGEVMGNIARGIRPYQTDQSRARRRSGKKNTRDYRFLGKLAPAVLYKVDKKEVAAQIGIIPGFRRTSNFAAEIVSRFQSGRDIPINPRMRRYFAGLGIPLASSRSTMKSPARPFIDKVYRSEGGTLTRQLETKFLERLMSY